MPIVPILISFLAIGYWARRFRMVVPQAWSARITQPTAAGSMTLHGRRRTGSAAAKESHTSDAYVWASSDLSKILIKIASFADALGEARPLHPAWSDTNSIPWSMGGKGSRRLGSDRSLEWPMPEAAPAASQASAPAPASPPSK